MPCKSNHVTLELSFLFIFIFSQRIIRVLAGTYVEVVPCLEWLKLSLPARHV